jgi:hypothetical protein
MDSHGIRPKHAATLVNSGGITFDNNFYDREVDVLYLHVGEPSTAVDFDGTAEGDATLSLFVPKSAAHRIPA